MKYRELLENANDAIVTFNLEGRFTSANKAAEQLIGYARDEVTKMNVSQILSPEHHDQLWQSIRRMSEGEKATLQEVDLIGKGGRRVFVESNRQLIYENGKAVGVQVISRDISERKQAEEALRHKQRELAEAQRLAQIGSWEWEEESNTMRWSDELYRIARRDPNLPPPSLEEIAHTYSASLLERIGPLVEDSRRTGNPYQLEIDHGLSGWYGKMVHRPG